MTISSTPPLPVPMLSPPEQPQATETNERPSAARDRGRRQQAFTSAQNVPCPLLRAPSEHPRPTGSSRRGVGLNHRAPGRRHDSCTRTEVAADAERLTFTPRAAIPRRGGRASATHSRHGSLGHVSRIDPATRIHWVLAGSPHRDVPAQSLLNRAKHGALTTVRFPPPPPLSPSLWRGRQ